MKYAIEVEGLTKSYSRIKVVNNLNIHVPEGKIYGFLGRNGAGKTTTIRMIMGLIRPESGKVSVLGRDACSDRRWASRNIGSIVESPGFYENLSAFDNLEITAEMYGVNKKGLDRLLEMVQLSGTGRKKVKDYSLGMKQRLGIANAMVHSPKILILDEPANGLDPAGIKDMRIFLRDLSENHGITIMISSHILSEIQQLADYIGIIDHGSLIEEIDAVSINAMDQSELILEVDEVDQTLGVLDDMKLKYNREKDAIRVFCSKSINSLLNRNLVSRGINVFNLSSVSLGLEERFISLTGGVRS